ncbi:MAG: molybdenum cofactor guanylyltransferase, partial [Candidatus Eisenbacteria bacterium]|nr:molybdenum cofactor guanylyltransferase [Candidatus Eisenbacteria bacterium]
MVYGANGRNGAAFGRTPPVAGFVLAGGESRRFGRDKALANYEGRPMLQRALDALRDAGLEPAVVAPDAGPYRSLCSSFVTSERPGRGPVEGLRAALKATQEPWALVL